MEALWPDDVDDEASSPSTTSVASYVPLSDDGVDDDVMFTVNLSNKRVINSAQTKHARSMRAIYVYIYNIIYINLVYLYIYIRMFIYFPSKYVEGLLFSWPSPCLSSLVGFLIFDPPLEKRLLYYKNKHFRQHLKKQKQEWVLPPIS